MGTNRAQGLEIHKSGGEGVQVLGCRAQDAEFRVVHVNCIVVQGYSGLKVSRSVFY